jgi:hypothetical protein
VGLSGRVVESDFDAKIRNGLRDRVGGSVAAAALPDDSGVVRRKRAKRSEAVAAFCATGSAAAYKKEGWRHEAANSLARSTPH